MHYICMLHHVAFAGLAASSFGGAHGVIVAIGGRRGGSSRHVSKVPSSITIRQETFSIL